MKELTDPEIRESFVNCTKGEVGRITVPRDLPDFPWADLDFLGWRDPGAPNRSYIVAEHDGQLVGFALRLASRSAGSHHRTMCSICLTTHPASGVTLMTARKARQSGNGGDTVGEYICSNLACSLYVRGKKRTQPGGRLKESLTEEEKVDRMKTKLAAFLDTLL
ncbi:FBP domain-containing protein [Streptomyces sp. ISL-100]|uniref:FBP domain-containing protein n=1 Tax=Streptomyces sp. ISL-100 TaxID=2819173 RepID=UPI001BE5D374|nr:FBP domain-containing protein [Streptomyces sp. ISL-100]MBT2399305.1 FBP domain-containing protein [Streptomyces sp. ISL-100]